MKLDAKLLRYITKDEFRVLTAVFKLNNYDLSVKYYQTEMGSRNHEIVPIDLILSIAKIKCQRSLHKILCELCRHKLLSHETSGKYNGYRLTYGGYDFLALKALSNRDAVTGIGNEIGVGKESDVILASSSAFPELSLVIKIHRLGRQSFRSVKNNRDYLKHRKASSWMYLSRLSASKEFEFMKALYEAEFPVPRPINHNRHIVVMEHLLNAVPLCSINQVENPGELYSSLMNLIVRLASVGLIHGDFNEFNLMINTETGKIYLIDFPQMVSISHKNAEFYFSRDVDCIRAFFKKKFSYESFAYPKFSEDVQRGDVSLDMSLSASGYNNCGEGQKEHLGNDEEFEEEEKEEEEENNSERESEEDF